jgi:hypothetical protein
MKQLILTLLLAASIGAAFVVTSAITASAGDNCYRADTPSNQIP